MSASRGYNFNGDFSGRDSYFAGGDLYYTQIMQERNNLLRDIAATKTRARILVILGFLMVLLGATAFMLSILGDMNRFGSGSVPDFTSFGGPKVGGVSVGIIGFGVAFIGQFVVVAGIVMHIVAAARRRRVGVLPPIPPAFYAPEAGGMVRQGGDPRVSGHPHRSLNQPQYRPHER